MRFQNDRVCLILGSGQSLVNLIILQAIRLVDRVRNRPDHGDGLVCVLIDHGRDSVILLEDDILILNAGLSYILINRLHGL